MHLWQAGHAAYAVGGGLRDLLLGRRPMDWDIATDALPERLLGLFPTSRYENRFGTVSVEPDLEITTFRRDHRYGDHRRPDAVTFTGDVLEDLARRDFTVNAIAWGRAPGEEAPAWVDPWAGRADLGAGLLRTVGDPAVRFDEDALRLLRAARLSAQLGLAVEAGTLGGMTLAAPLVEHVSQERLGQELTKLLGAPRPSDGFRVLQQTGVLASALPELAAQIGVPQNKQVGGDLWDHTLATVDAAAEITGDARDGHFLLAALLHDIGKPATWKESGSFLGHDEVGAEVAEQVLTRLAIPRREVATVCALIRWHMFDYRPTWTDAAVRRFMRRVGPDLVPDLIRLREADNLGSGQPADAGALPELRQRVEEQLSRGVPLGLRDLAVNGTDLQTELGLAPAPALGRLLDRLLDSVIADPERNTRRQLLIDARSWAADMRASEDAR